MNFLEKLDMLMAAQGLNKRKLSHLSGVPYTTIDGFYKRGYENAQLSNLRKIANALNTSLDFLVTDDSNEIKKSPGADESAPRDEKEFEIMGLVYGLDDSQKDFLISLLEKVAARNQRKSPAAQVSADESISVSGHHDQT